MSHRNHAIIPHPVLSPQRRDYADECTFEARVVHRVLSRGGQDINLTVKYQLKCDTLRKLIEGKQACFLALLECSRTYRRERQSSFEDEDLFTLTRSDWEGTIGLTPYIASNTEVSGFAAPEHSAMIKTLAPAGLNLPAGAILAIGNTTEIEIEENDGVESIFDLIPNRDMAPGTFATDLTGQRIAISMHPDTAVQVNSIRSHPIHAPILNQALYLHSLDKAIRLVQEYPDRRWAAVITNRLVQHGYDLEDEDLADNSEEIAQVIFEHPLGKLTSVILDTDPDD